MQSAARSVAVIIPAYNEGERLLRTVHGLSAAFARMRGGLHFPVRSLSLVVVDDGSTPPLALPPGFPDTWCLRHLVNLGQGAALATGIAFAHDTLGDDYYVTMDADGQHDPDDLPALLNTLHDERCDIVFGNRFAAGAPRMPALRRLILRGAILLERVLTGLELADAHNGFRAFNRRTAGLLRLQQNRMAHATEIKLCVARHGLSFREVPVTVTYSEETLAKGQRNLGSMLILRDLVAAYLFRS